MHFIESYYGQVLSLLTAMCKGIRRSHCPPGTQVQKHFEFLYPLENSGKLLTLSNSQNA